MIVFLNGTPKEIADLVSLLQSQLNVESHFRDEISSAALYQAVQKANCDKDEANHKKKAIDFS